MIRRNAGYLRDYLHTLCQHRPDCIRRIWGRLDATGSGYLGKNTWKATGNGRAQTHLAAGPGSRV